MLVYKSTSFQLHLSVFGMYPCFIGSKYSPVSPSTADEVADEDAFFQINFFSDGVASSVGIKDNSVQSIP